jgi:hypothetical protein
VSDASTIEAAWLGAWVVLLGVLATAASQSAAPVDTIREFSSAITTENRPSGIAAAPNGDLTASRPADDRAV